MRKLLQRALDQGLELNERAAASAVNGFDWLFRRKHLVKSGQTEFVLIHDGDLMSVRFYSLDGEEAIALADGTSLPIQRNQHAVPLVLVPPLGVTTETFDLMPNRSLVRYMAARGFKTYLICWGKPGRRHAQLDMQDYADRMMAEALAAVRKHSGADEVSLMGWCMGGLLALLHAGLPRKRAIRNMVTVASPIDMRGGGLVAGVAQVINTPAKLIRKYTDLRMNALNPAVFHAPGWVTTLAFKLTDPIGSVTTYWDLVTKLWDREFVESHTTTSDYLNNMLSYPAGVVGDMLVKVAIDNKLASGEIELGKKLSRFRSIRAAILVFAGDRDVLVSPSTAQGILDLVGSKDKCFEVAPGGHMGVILGATAQRAVWEKSADWLAQRSQAKPRVQAKPQPALA
jgi:polyhydroxyalkanoate synthase